MWQQLKYYLSGPGTSAPKKVQKIYFVLVCIMYAVISSGLVLYLIFGDNQSVLMVWQWLMVAMCGIIVGISVGWNMAMDSLEEIMTPV